MKKYENIADFIRQNMDGWHGDFTIAVTDLSEKEEGCLLASINADGKNAAQFFIHADGREEQDEF